MEERKEGRIQGRSKVNRNGLRLERERERQRERERERKREREREKEKKMVGMRTGENEEGK